MHKDPLANYKKHQRDKYMFDQELKFYGSMFFWYYLVLCLSEFNTSIHKRRRELTKKIDTKVLLSLKLVKFTSTYFGEWMKEAWGKIISYRDLVIVWWLVFDEKSVRNKEFRELLKWTRREHILNQPTPTSYDDFFMNVDSDGIDKINFNKFLAYLPREMFMDAISLLLKCDKWVVISIDEDPKELWESEILWYKWRKIYWYFLYALKFFIKKPSQKYLKGLEWGFPVYRYDWRKALCTRKEKELMDKLDWKSDSDLRYIRQLNPSSEGWIEAIEPVLQWIVNKKNKDKSIELDWVDIYVEWEKKSHISFPKK